MQINRNNYEMFLIDLLEGNLEPSLEQELLGFLEENPDLKEEYHLLANDEITLIPAEGSSPDFSFLKKEEAYITQEEMIASIEGDLAPLPEKELQRKLAVFPEYNKDYQLFKLSKLVPEKIVFEGKSQLKKKIGVVIPLYYRFAAVAAVFVAFILAGVLYFGSNQNQDQTGQTAMVTPMPAEENESAFEPEKTMVVKEKNRSKESSKLNIQVAAKNEMGKQEMQTITAKSTQLPYTSIAQTKLNLQPKSTITFAPSNAIEENSNNPVYLKPSEWLWMQMKKQIPERALALADTLSNGGAAKTGVYAMELVQKTTGITYEEKKNATNGTRGYAIVGRYFAYERIIHP